MLNPYISSIQCQPLGQASEAHADGYVEQNFEVLSSMRLLMTEESNDVDSDSF
ncbi:hypothetical protein YC2023_115716 [Brassica napus]